MNLAIFGGTFDPVHWGHITVALTAADECGLDRVLLIPAGFPPHKHTPAGAPYADRLRMVELACAQDNRLEPSRLEAPDGIRDRNYSIDTIQHVRNEMKNYERLFFILGADAFAEITLWHRWQEVVRLVEFIVVSRPGTKIRAIETPSGTRVQWLRDVQMPMSSTEIRKRLGEGVNVDEWLPPAVAEYIRERGLYGCRAGASRAKSTRVVPG